MSATTEVIFLTGASGYLGSHILIQLLEKGHRVRAAVRENKSTQVKQAHARFNDQLEVIPITDIATDRFTDALKGVDALIHTASPLAGRESDTEAMLKGAIEGTLNIVRQASEAGVKRIVVTSSIVTVMTPKFTFTDQDWYPTTREQARQTRGFEAYIASKTLAESALWEFSEARPHLDITTLNPPYLYGPFAEGFRLPEPNYSALSTALFIYRFITVDGTFPSTAFYADVRDIARAHVQALKSPSSSQVGRKRIIISSPHEMDFRRVIALIAEKRPGLKDRLSQIPPPDIQPKKLSYNSKRVEEVLGIKDSDFTLLDDTILDNVDAVIALEKQWITAGFDIKVPSQ